MIIKKIWFEGERLYASTDDGRTLWQSLLYYPRLRFAKAAQRDCYSLNAFGIHWDGLDEDVSFESFEYPEPEPEGIARIFLSHPEINASAFARRLGMKQSLLAAYINGTKHPSVKQQQRIIDEINALGRELSTVGL